MWPIDTPMLRDTVESVRTRRNPETDSRRRSGRGTCITCLRCVKEVVLCITDIHSAQPNTFKELVAFLEEHLSFRSHTPSPITQLTCTGHAPSPSRSIPCPFQHAISPADDARLVDFLLYWPTYGRTFQDGRVIFPRRHGDTIFIEDVDAVLQFCKVVKELSNRADHSFGLIDSRGLSPQAPLV